jgi:Tol biopolymer transport system component
VSDRSGTRRIYVANPDGSDVTALTTGEAPAWSADGTKIAFHRPVSGIYVIDADGSNERFLRAGFTPTWSPDLTKIAYQTGIGSGGGIYVMNADGSNPRLLISHEFASPGWGDYCACYPAWSPDGRTIAFVRANYDEPFAVYTMSADGSGSPTPLPGNGWRQDQPAWSPDGSRIAFDTAGYWVDPDTNVRSSADQIASVTLSGSDFRVHVTAGSRDDYVGHPAWSPDGRSLLFARGSRGSPTRIFIAREDGSVAQLIPEAQNPAKSDYRDREPTWSWGH